MPYYLFNFYKKIVYVYCGWEYGCEYECEYGWEYGWGIWMVNMDGNMDKKNIINSLPVEIILYIFKFMDAYTLNKLASVFKKAMSYRGIYYEIQKIKERREK